MLWYRKYKSIYTVCVFHVVLRAGVYRMCAEQVHALRRGLSRVCFSHTPLASAGVDFHSIVMEGQEGPCPDTDNTPESIHTC